MIFLIFIFLFLVPVSAKDIQVGLFETKTLYLSSNHKFEIRNLANEVLGSSTKRILLRSSPATTHQMLLVAPPDLLGISEDIVFVCKQEPCLFKLKCSIEDSNPYNVFRGRILVHPRDGIFTVINQLDIEDYLLGVVPGEMPSTWPQEALKAQAVAARTYTLKNLNRRRALGYDLNADVSDQMYLGYLKETASTNLAVQSTRGEVLRDSSGVLIDAYYSSHAGRFTNSPEEAWGLSPSFALLTVKELAEDSKPWEVFVSWVDLNKALADLRLGEIKAIQVVERTYTGRMARVLILGDSKQVTLTGEEFRHKLKLRSTDASISYEPLGIRVSGFGFGHGIGMSQYGAKALASKLDYKQILGVYYSAVRVDD